MKFVRKCLGMCLTVTLCRGTATFLAGISNANIIASEHTESTGEGVTIVKLGDNVIKLFDLAEISREDVDVEYAALTKSAGCSSVVQLAGNRKEENFLVVKHDQQGNIPGFSDLLMLVKKHRAKHTKKESLIRTFSWTDDLPSTDKKFLHGASPLDGSYENSPSADKAPVVIPDKNFDHSNWSMTMVGGQSVRSISSDDEDGWNTAGDASADSADYLPEVYYAGDHLEIGWAMIKMERVRGDTLKTWNKTQRAVPNSDKQTRNLLEMIFKMSTSVFRMHKHSKQIHRDLKLANLMYDGDTVKIIDLDEAKAIGDEILPESAEKQTRNSPPELSTRRCANEKEDVYSLGVCFFDILASCKQNVLESQKLWKELQQAQTIGQRIDIMKNAFLGLYPKAVILLVARMLSQEPNERPTQNQVRSRSALVLSRHRVRGARRLHSE